jgi:hypothetical protein
MSHLAGLASIPDINISYPVTDGAYLAYDSGSGKWIASTTGIAVGIDDVLAVGQNLSTDRDINLQNNTLALLDGANNLFSIQSVGYGQIDINLGQNFSDSIYFKTPANLTFTTTQPRDIEFDSGSNVKFISIDDVVFSYGGNVAQFIGLDGSVLIDAYGLGTFDDPSPARLAGFNASGYLVEISPALVGVSDHTLLSNIGTNSHTDIDNHIADSTIHYTQAAINLAASQITSGTFDNARISQSSVTQHEGDLSIAWSQITGGGIEDVITNNPNLTANAYINTKDNRFGVINDQEDGIDGYLYLDFLTQSSSMTGSAVEYLQTSMLIGDENNFTTLTHSYDTIPPLSGNFYIDVPQSLYINYGINTATFFASDGGLTLSSYGSGSVTGTATYGLAVTSSGKLVEVALGGGGASQLSDLSDVSSSTPNTRNVLVANGANWESRALTEADISDLQSYLTSETNDLTASVIWANVPDANITQTSVTQYEGVLSIGWGQISGAPSFLTSVDLSYTPSTRIIGNTGGTNVTLPLFDASNAGLVPTSTGGTINFLRADGAWASIPINVNIGTNTQVAFVNVAENDLDYAATFTYNKTSRRLNLGALGDTVEAQLNVMWDNDAAGDSQRLRYARLEHDLLYIGGLDYPSTDAVFKIATNYTTLRTTLQTSTGAKYRTTTGWTGTTEGLFFFDSDTDDGLTAGSGTQSYFDIQARINQTGTAGYNGFQLNVIETLTGSGTKNIFDWQLGGTSYHTLANTGQLSMSQYGSLSFTGTNVAFLGVTSGGDVIEIDPATVGGGASLTEDVTQTSHGLSVGDVIRSNGTANQYTTAQADSGTNAEVVGIVTAVAGVNDFTFTFGGVIDDASIVPVAAANTVLFLDESVAGGLTTTEPSSFGEISKPVAVVIESGQRMIWLNYRGSEVGTISGVKDSKSITVPDITGSEDIPMFETDDDITITKIRAVHKGTTSTPSVTWTIKHSTDASAVGNEVVTSGTTTTSTTTGDSVTVFNDATIPAGSFVWLETTNQSGTVDKFHITIHYTFD